jgi:hypothetical protein
MGTNGEELYLDCGKAVIDQRHQAKSFARFFRHPSLLTLGMSSVAGVRLWDTKPLRQFREYRRAIRAGGPAYNL